MTKHGASSKPIAPLALEAVRQIDAIFDIKRAINGVTAAERLAHPPTGRPAAGRRPLSLEAPGALPIVPSQLSRHNDVAEAMDYMLKRWDAVVLSIDEKSQIQALVRIRPRLPLNPNKCTTAPKNPTSHWLRQLLVKLFLGLTSLFERMPHACRHLDALRADLA